jgi:hypothetical protein
MATNTSEQGAHLDQTERMRIGAEISYLELRKEVRMLQREISRLTGIYEARMRKLNEREKLQGTLGLID